MENGNRLRISTKAGVIWMSGRYWGSPDIIHPWLRLETALFSIIPGEQAIKISLAEAVVEFLGLINGSGNGIFCLSFRMDFSGILKKLMSSCVWIGEKLLHENRAINFSSSIQSETDRWWWKCASFCYLFPFISIETKSDGTVNVSIYKSTCRTVN